jgi:hypothetical protein
MGYKGRQSEAEQRKHDRGKELARKRAAALGHFIGSWHKVSQGWRGGCVNPECQAHIILRTGSANYSELSSPTSLKRHCPYIVRNVRLKGRQMIKRAS